MNTRVYLVDDDEAVRDGLSLLLQTINYDVTTFADPMKFLDDLPTLSAGCIIMDIRMPMISGLKVQEKLVEANCSYPIIIISGHGDINACRKAFKNGAIDFISKPIDEQDLIDAIQKSEAVLQSENQKQEEVNEVISLVEKLTPREKEVLEMISRGWTTKEIASSLDLSPRTVESHRAKIADKIGTTSVAEMARIVIEAGL
ncbi:response regulator transcription factor [Sneathiella aquimaris]|uniref:response regulator transcription factor n=1 Tax=Sneathiella aquimaris TaxID=2599305 RepID=UPI00146C6A1B|nr:response regulator [Sneathiella aquimaris]